MSLLEFFEARIEVIEALENLDNLKGKVEKLLKNNGGSLAPTSGDGIQTKLNELNNRVTILENKSLESEQHAPDFDNIQSSFLELKGKIDILESGDFSNRIHNIEQDNLSTRIQSLENKNNQIESKNKEVEEKFSNPLERLSTVENTTNTLQQEVNTLQHSIGCLETEVKELKKRFDEPPIPEDLLDRLSAAEKNASEAKNETNILSQEDEKMKNDLLSVKNEVTFFTGK